MAPFVYTIRSSVEITYAAEASHEALRSANSDEIVDNGKAAIFESLATGRIHFIEKMKNRTELAMNVCAFAIDARYGYSV